MWESMLVTEFQSNDKILLNYDISILFQEWSLWSRCFGKVLVINGVSSSGKTTLAKALTEFGFNHISFDKAYHSVLYSKIAKIIPLIKTVNLLTKREIIKIIQTKVFSSAQFNIEFTNKQNDQIQILEQQIDLIDKSIIRNIQAPSTQEIIEQISEETKKYFFRGENVVVDTVMYSVEDITMFFTLFNFPKRIILLYSPLENNLMNCFLRPLDEYRYPTQTIYQFMEMYSFNPTESQAMILDKEKILASLDHINDNLKKRFCFFSEAQFLDIKKETEEAIKKIKFALASSDKLFIASHIFYDAAIVIPQGKVTWQLLKFLINFSQQRDIDLKFLSVHYNFLAFYNPKVAYLKEESKHSVVFSDISTIFRNVAIIEGESLPIITYDNLITGKYDCIIVEKELPSHKNFKDYISSKYIWNGYHIIEAISKLNKFADYFLRKIFLPNRYQEMQKLITKYSINMQVFSEESLKNTYKKIALKTHPDKTIGINEELRADMQKDFMKANNLLKQDTIASSEIYKPVMNKLYKANLFIKVADTSIDITKGFIKPTLESGLKISIDFIQLSSMYYGSYGVMLPITIIGAAYQIYNDDYEGAVKSVITSTGITFMSTAVCAAAPALSVILTAGFTGYAGYTMLQNGYELYYEWQEDIEITNNLEHEKILEEVIL